MLNLLCMCLQPQLQLSLIGPTDQSFANVQLEKENFYNGWIVRRSDNLQMQREWLNWQNDCHSIHLLNYHFLFPPPVLVDYFRAINYDAMTQAYEDTLLSLHLLEKMTWTDPATQLGTIRHPERLAPEHNNFFVLELSWKNPLTDALDQLWRRHKRELLRPLKVRFSEQEGEEAVDFGGVQQEFFRLIIREAFNPDYGDFPVDHS